MLSVLVERDDQLLFERYYRGDVRKARLDVFSVTKSVTSTLVGIAVHRGLLHLDQRLGDFFPDVVHAAHDRRVRRITLRHLLTMTAGYRDDTPQARSDDWVHTLVDRPLSADPGRSWAYDNGSYHLLSAVLTKVTGGTEADFAQRVLFGPLAIAAPRWATDGQGNSLGNTGLRLGSRDLMRLGELFLHEGRFHGRQVVPASWVRDATSRKFDAGFSYGWWILRFHGIKGFAAFGYGGQTITVLPAKRVVVVVTGSGDDLRRVVFGVVLPALHLR